jgi:hypothetical protein
MYQECKNISYEWRFQMVENMTYLEPNMQPIDMPLKSSKRLNKRRDNFGLGTPHSRRRARESLTHRTKDREKMGNLMKLVQDENKEGYWEDEEIYREMV